MRPARHQPCQFGVLALERWRCRRASRALAPAVEDAQHHRAGAGRFLHGHAYRGTAAVRVVLPRFRALPVNILLTTVMGLHSEARLHSTVLTLLPVIWCLMTTLQPAVRTGATRIDGCSGGSFRALAALYRARHALRFRHRLRHAAGSGIAVHSSCWPCQWCSSWRWSSASQRAGGGELAGAFDCSSAVSVLTWPFAPQLVASRHFMSQVSGSAFSPSTRFMKAGRSPADGDTPHQARSTRALSLCFAVIYDESDRVAPARQGS